MNVWTPDAATAPSRFRRRRRRRRWTRAGSTTRWCRHCCATSGRSRARTPRARRMSRCSRTKCSTSASTPSKWTRRSPYCRRSQRKISSCATCSATWRRSCTLGGGWRKTTLRAGAGVSCFRKTRGRIPSWSRASTATRRCWACRAPSARRCARRLAEMKRRSTCARRQLRDCSTRPT